MRAKRTTRRPARRKASRAPWPPARANLPPLPILVALGDGNELPYQRWLEEQAPGKQYSRRTQAPPPFTGSFLADSVQVSPPPFRLFRAQTSQNLKTQ